jgi:hypothetical protein
MIPRGAEGNDAVGKFIVRLPSSQSGHQ